MFLYQAQRAEYENRHSVQALHLLKAGLWNEAHTVIMKHLAAPAIIIGVCMSVYVCVYVCVRVCECLCVCVCV